MLSLKSIRKSLRPVKPFIEQMTRGVRLLSLPRIRQNYNIVSSIMWYGIPDRHVFYGYYDKNPVSPNGNWLLAHSASKELRADAKGEKVQIGVFEKGKPDEFIPIGTTHAWNWQQGCRMMWWPGRQNAVIYNSIENDRPISLVVEVPSGHLIRKYDFPIYDLSPDGTWSVGLDFARLHRLRPGYGYSCLKDSSVGCLVPDNDGIRLRSMNGTSAHREKIFSLRELTEVGPKNWPDGAEHYINHLCISPCGKWIFLIHLWQVNGQREGRAILCSADFSTCRTLVPEKTVSHYTWQPDGKLLLYLCSGARGVYRRFDPETFRECQPLMNCSNWGDGHPTISSDGRHVVVDLYPNWFGDRSLHIVDVASRSVREILRSYSPYQFFADQRCDLHPRWVDERSIAIDSAHTQLRQIGIIHLHRRFFNEK